MNRLLISSIVGASTGHCLIGYHASMVGVFAYQGGGNYFSTFFYMPGTSDVIILASDKSDIWKTIYLA